jgi:non-ribosomal peptide synthetase-like protein
MAVLLLFRFLGIYAVVLLMAIAAGFYQRFGDLAFTLGVIASVLFNVLLAAFAERAVLGFHRLVPKFVSIYDPHFWRHERLWKVLATPVFAGTPFRALQWRLLGVRVGKRLFDDGATIPEKTLVSLGDDVVLNAGSVIQCHSLEDGTFKTDHTTLGDGVVLGVGAFVHYGVTMGKGSMLEADGFLMKGEETTPFTPWSGNPATETGPVTRPLTEPAALPAVEPAAVPIPAPRARHRSQSGARASLRCDRGTRARHRRDPGRTPAEPAHEPGMAA